MERFARHPALEYRVQPPELAAEAFRQKAGGRQKFLADAVPLNIVKEAAPRGHMVMRQLVRAARGFGKAASPTGDLAKRQFDESKVRRDGDGQFSSAGGGQRGRYHGQFHDSGPSAGKKTPGFDGGPDRSKGMVSSLYARRPPEVLEESADAGPSAGSMFGPGTKLTPRQPTSLKPARVQEVLREAGEITKARSAKLKAEFLAGEHKDLMRGSNQQPDPKVLGMALAHARNFALHDMGLIDYRFSIKEEHHADLKRMIPFMWHARRSMANTLRQDGPPELAVWRKEFGTPFKDGRTYERSSRSGNEFGHKEGDPKKSFYRHMILVKRDGGWDEALEKTWLGVAARGAGIAVRGVSRGVVAAGKLAGQSLATGGAAVARQGSAMVAASRAKGIRSNVRSALSAGRASRVAAVDSAERAAAGAYRAPAGQGFAASIQGIGNAAGAAGIKTRADAFRSSRASSRGWARNQSALRGSAKLVGGLALGSGAALVGRDIYRSESAARDNRRRALGLSKRTT
jgi:hypothetical protein